MVGALRAGLLECVVQLWYIADMASVTSSYRIPKELNDQLESTARKFHKGKNWVINEALKHYLKQTNYEWLREEAKRQSIAASKIPWKDAELWEEALAEVWDAD